MPIFPIAEVILKKQLVIVARVVYGRAGDAGQVWPHNV